MVSCNDAELAISYVYVVTQHDIEMEKCSPLSYSV